MIISCPECATRYVIPDAAIGADGRSVRCAKCNHNWFQSPNIADDLAAPPPASTVPASAVSSPPSPSVDHGQGEIPRPGFRGLDYATPASQGPSAPETQQTPAPAPAPAPPVAIHRHDHTAAPAENLTAHRDPDRDAHGNGWGSVNPDGAQPAADDEWDANASDGGFWTQVKSAVAAMFGRSSKHAPHDHKFTDTADSHPRPRRNWLKIGTIAAVFFALVSAGVIASISYFGMPSWIPIPHSEFGPPNPDLKMEFPRDQQDRRPLPNGAEFFGANGTITNISSKTVKVPSIMIIMRDEHERIVYSWEVPPSKEKLAPGERLAITEAVTDVPKSAKFAEIGWKAAR